MKIEDLPFPLKTPEEIRKMSKEELDIYKVEQMADLEFVYNMDNYKMKKEQRKDEKRDKKTEEGIKEWIMKL